MTFARWRVALTSGGVRSNIAFRGWPIRILTVVDCHTRVSLALEPRASFRPAQVVGAMKRITAERGRPKTTRRNNGPEFAGRVLDQWAFFNRVAPARLQGR
jgi:putative transposase